MHVPMRMIGGQSILGEIRVQATPATIFDLVFDVIQGAHPGLPQVPCLWSGSL